jgi:pimeloyl-ACP methyl ester carboxylesterase
MKYIPCLLIIIFVLIPSVIFAQIPCTISVNVDVEEELPAFVTEPVTDCGNPFGITDELPMPYELKIGDNLFSDEAEIETENGLLQLPLEFTGNPEYSNVQTYLFEHTETGYEYVNQNPFELPAPTEVEVAQYSEIFFGNTSSAQLYTEIYFADYKYDYFEDQNGDALIDEETGHAVQERFYDFVEYVTQERTTYPDPIGPGTYTLVFNEEELILSSKDWIEKVFSIFIQTAHAQYSLPVRRFGITFTLNEISPELTGASSVLFLPGIQASRLYKEGLFGGTDRVWPPNELFGNDVNDLRMTDTGESAEDIYTNDVIDTTAGVGDVYAGFERFLADLVFDEVIENWTPFAYDWRYDVVDITENGTQYEEGVRSAIDEIEYLAEGSFSGKVTIIGHSNGGLLAKALLIELERSGKAGLVDKVVFLGTPQLGTPKAIGTILHGYDQGDGLTRIIMDAHDVRRVIQNLPGAYGLLPSLNYFEGLSEPLVTFSDSVSTAPYRSIYGASITNYGDYIGFLRGADGLERGIDEPTFVPVRGNSPMLDDALSMHDTVLDDWVAPDGVEVIEIVGTGLPTMKSIEYREVIEDICLIPTICEAELKMKPYARLSHYGDGTVMQHSAEGYSNEKKRYFVNLEEIRRANITSRFEHHNLSEISDVQKFISDLLVGTTTLNSEFISPTHAAFVEEYDIEAIDSPVRMLATDNQGNQTGVILVDGMKTVKEEISGSQYFEFGDTKYLVIPKGANRIVKLFGEDYGGYSLTTATLDDEDQQSIQTVLENASTTPHMIAEYSKQSGQYSSVTTDLDGDGSIDVETTLEGEIIEEEVMASYPLLKTTIESLTLSRIYKQTLLVLIKTAEYYANKTPTKPLYRALEDGALKTAQELIKVYVKKGYMQAAKASILQEMIQTLKDKQ